jgi:transcriptional regulator with XRE-family HTH domain
MAEDLATTKASLSRYENDLRDPKIEFASKAAEYLGVTLDYLLCKTDIQPGELFNGTGALKGAIDAAKNHVLNRKDEKDVEKLLNKTMDYIESQEGIMLNGEILDEQDIELLRQAIKNGLEYAKISNKKKYTPRKYRKE